MAGKSAFSAVFGRPNLLKKMEGSMQMLPAAPWQKPVNAETPFDDELCQAFREVLQTQESTLLSAGRVCLMESAVPSLN